MAWRRTNRSTEELLERNEGNHRPGQDIGPEMTLEEFTRLMQALNNPDPEPPARRPPSPPIRRDNRPLDEGIAERRARPNPSVAQPGRAPPRRPIPDEEDSSFDNLMAMRAIRPGRRVVPPAPPRLPITYRCRSLEEDNAEMGIPPTPNPPARSAGHGRSVLNAGWSRGRGGRSTPSPAPTLGPDEENFLTVWRRMYMLEDNPGRPAPSNMENAMRAFTPVRKLVRFQLDDSSESESDEDDKRENRPPQQVTPRQSNPVESSPVQRVVPEAGGGREEGAAGGEVTSLENVRGARRVRLGRGRGMHVTLTRNTPIPIETPLGPMIARRVQDTPQLVSSQPGPSSSSQDPKRKVEWMEVDPSTKVPKNPNVKEAPEKQLTQVTFATVHTVREVEGVEVGEKVKIAPPKLVLPLKSLESQPETSKSALQNAPVKMETEQSPGPDKDVKVEQMEVDPSKKILKNPNVKKATAKPVRKVTFAPVLTVVVIDEEEVEENVKIAPPKLILPLKPLEPQPGTSKSTLQNAPVKLETEQSTSPDEDEEVDTPPKKKRPVIKPDGTPDPAAGKGVPKKKAASKQTASEIFAKLKMRGGNPERRRHPYTPYRAVGEIKERGMIIEMRIGRMQDAPTYPKPLHLWRCIIKCGGVESVADSRRKVVAREMASVDFLDKMRQAHSHVKIPKYHVPDALFIDPRVFHLVEKLALQENLTTTYLERVRPVRDEYDSYFEFVCSCFVGTAKFQGVNFIREYAKLLAAKAAYEELAQKQLECTRYFTAGNCDPTVEYCFQESETFQVVEVIGSHESEPFQGNPDEAQRDNARREVQKKFEKDKKDDQDRRRNMPVNVQRSTE